MLHRNTLHPPNYMYARRRQPLRTSRLWPRIWVAIRVLNQDARIPALGPKNGNDHFHHIVNERSFLWMN